MDSHLTPDQWTDRQLACRTQSGCTDSYNELVRRHGARLLRYISFRIRDQHEAEDLLQETFVRAYERIGRYDAKWSFSTWIYTIASRILISHYRRKGMVPVGEMPSCIAPGGVVTSSTDHRAHENR